MSGAAPLATLLCCLLLVPSASPASHAATGSATDGADEIPAFLQPRSAADGEAPTRSEGAAGPPPVEAEAPPQAADPCGHVLVRIEERRAYLERIAAERDAFAWVESSADAEALRLLQGLRRCQEHPDDEDCHPPPIERDLRDLEPPRHQYERWPSELVVEGGAGEAVIHDPGLLQLHDELQKCRRAASPQPLLDRSSHQPLLRGRVPGAGRPLPDSGT